MIKYIDSEAFFKVINTMPYKDTSYPDASAYNGAISDVADMLTHFPAADVAEVVRCKDCKWLEKWHKELPPYDTGLYCTRPNQQSMNLLPTDYCSYGEKR